MSAGLQPMLATSGRPSARIAWVAEPKLDGWRALGHVDSDVRVRTRSGRDITDALPELADALDGRSAVLDGELVARQGWTGDFYRLAPSRARRRRTRPPRAFDLLAIDRNLLLGERYEHRRRFLENLGLAGPAWHTTPAWVDDFVAVDESSVLLGLEGAVLKRLHSHYRSGQRSRDWLKLSTAEWREVHAPMRHER